MLQTEIVIEHLQTNGSITSLEAINLYGITRLSGVIYKLKKLGYNITSEIKTVKTRYGKANIAVYRLGE